MTAPLTKTSLLEGRNQAPLSEHEVRRASNTFLGMDNKVNARYVENTSTRFIAGVDSEGQEYGEIVFSDDIYPGRGIANPNSALSLNGAVAHELAHYYRWQDKTELPHETFTHLDEAMTSLEAAARFSSYLSPTDMQGLISDSLHRLRLFMVEQEQQAEN